MRILVVDDISSNSKLLQYLLQDKATVDIADNGARAVLACRAIHYDLVLMDVMMPLMDGIEASELIRKDGYEGRIIFVTAYHEFAKGFTEEDGVLLKPINAEVLKRKVFIDE